MDKFFTVGQVSKMYNISKQTLIFYDKKKIFSPSGKNKDNNYRYYSIKDMEILDNILFLRELDMPLDDIKKYLEVRNLQYSRNMLINHKNKIDEKIKSLKNVRNKIDVIISDLIEAHNYNLLTKDTPTITHCESIDVIKFKIDYPNDIDCAYMAFRNIVNYFTYKNIECSYKFGVIVDYNDILENNFLKQKDAICLIGDFDDDNKTTISNGTYAIYYHKGSYETISNSYIYLIDYINSQNYKIIGDSIEFCIIDSFCEKNEDNYITKIMIPIKSNF